MMENKKSASTEQSAVVSALDKSGVSRVSINSSTPVEMFQYVVQLPLEQRRHEWTQSVGERLLELETKGVDLTELQSNENFITAVMQASAAAIRTHQVSKIKALRNALINIAVGKGPEETIQHILLSTIDQLSEMHIRVLQFARNPNPPPGMSMGGLGNVLESNIPVLRGHRTLYDQLWKDLYSRGLVSGDNLHMTMSGSGLSQSQTTSLGLTLLNLIQDPL